MNRGLLFVAAALALGLSARATSSDPWPEIPATSQSDPSLHSGRLPNGLRYFVYPNDTPKDHVAMRLIVAAGSRNERPGQYGVAHLIEHMAFRSARGSEYGALMKQLERLGVGLGPGATAYTYYDKTQFLLNLPRNDATTLLTALKVFQAFASDTKFDPASVETEKQVVLSEERLHQVEGENSAFEYYGFLWPQIGSIRRPIGGSELSISALTARDCATFYADWYRPDHMAVIIVGPVDPEKTIAMLRDTLGKFTARTRKAPPIPEVKPPVETPLNRVRFDAIPVNASNQVDLTLSHSWVEKHAPFSSKREMEDIRLNLALTMFELRMRALSFQPGINVGSINLEPLDPYPAIGLRDVQMTVVGEPQSWDSTLRTSVTELRRAEAFGFTEHEFELAKASFENSLRIGIRYWPTRLSEQVVDQLVFALESGQPVFTAQTYSDRAEAALRKITLEQCNAAFRDTWGKDSLPNVFLMAPPSVTLRTTAIPATLDAAKAAHITPPRPAPASPPFPYESFGAPGKLVQEQHLGDLDVWLDRFDNGVRFNFKHTDFESDMVNAYIRVGTGRLSLPRDEPGLSLAAQSAMLTGGLVHETAEQLAELSSTRTLWISFYVDDDALMFQVRAAREDFPLALKVATAYIHDPAFRASVMPQVRVTINQAFDRAVGTPAGELGLEEESILAGGDHRFGLGSREDTLRRTMSEIRTWLKPQLQSGPIEMSIVGDIPYQDARSLVAATIGALPKRDERPADTGDGIARFGSPDIYNLEGIGMSLQDGISYVWLTPWVRTMQDDRRLNLLSQVINQRLRARLRDALGISYVTDGEYISHDGFTGFCYLQFYTQVNPLMLQRSVSAIENELHDLATNGVGEDEFNRAKNPWVQAYDANLRQNPYWGMTVLSNCQQRPANIEAARNRTADTHAISREEINALLKRVLVPGQALQFIVELKPPSTVVVGSFTSR